MLVITKKILTLKAPDRMSTGLTAVPQPRRVVVAAMKVRAHHLLAQ